MQRTPHLTNRAVAAHAHRCHVALERGGRLVVRLRIQRPRPDLVVDVLVQVLLYGCEVLQACSQAGWLKHAAKRFPRKMKRPHNL